MPIKAPFEGDCKYLIFYNLNITILTRADTHIHPYTLSHIRLVNRNRKMYVCGIEFLIFPDLLIENISLHTRVSFLKSFHRFLYVLRIRQLLMAFF